MTSKKQALIYGAIFFGFIFIFAAFDLSSIVKNQKNAKEVFVSVSGTAADEYHKIKVFGVLAGDKEVRMKRQSNVWLPETDGYINGIRISFSEGALRKISEVRVKIGERVFSYSPKEVIAKWTLLSNREEGPDSVFYGAPRELSLAKAGVPFASVKPAINWGGDARLFMLAIKDAYRLALVLAAAALTFYLLRRRYREHYKLAFAVFLLTFAVSAVFALIGIDPHHDGIMFKPALDVANGKVLFKDTFSMYGAGSILLQALAIKVFGNYLVVIRLLTAFFYALISLFLFLIWARFMPRWLAAFSCALWLLLSHFFILHPSIILFPWSTVYATFTTVLCIYLLFLYLEKGKAFYWFLIGAAAAMTFWFKQNCGVTTFASILAYLLIIAVLKKDLFRALKMSSLFSLGALSVFSLVLLWLYSNGALDEFWLQSIKYPTGFAKNNFYDPYHEPLAVALVKRMLLLGTRDGFATYIWVLLPAATIWLFSGIAVRWAGSKELDGKDMYILAAAVVSLFNWVNYYPIGAIFQFQMSATPMVGLLNYFIYDVSVNYLSNTKLLNMPVAVAAMEDFKKFLSYFSFQRINSKAIPTSVILAVLILGTAYQKDALFRVRDGLRKIKRNHFQVNSIGVLSGMVVEKSEVDFYNDISSEIKTHSYKYPGSNIVSITGSALYAALQADNGNFSPMYLHWTWVNNFIDPDYTEKLHKELAGNKDLVFSEYFVLDGYVPKKSYLIERSFQEPFALMTPAAKDNIFTLEKLPIKDSVFSLELPRKDNIFSPDSKRDNAFPLDMPRKDGIFSLELPRIERKASVNLAFRLRLLRDAEINSIVVYLTHDRLIPKVFGLFEFENEILPNVLSEADRSFMKQKYVRNDLSETCELDEAISESDMDRLKTIFINLFLHNKYLARWDTIGNSKDAYVMVRLNEELIINDEKKDDLALSMKKDDIMDLILPYIHKTIYGKERVKIRINYNGDKYAEYVL